MKTNIFRTSSILAGLVLLVAVSLSSNAQQTPRQQQPAQQQERPILDLPVQQLDAEALRVRVPHCPKPPVVQMHDVADNFNPPGVPVMLSPALTAYLNVNQITPKSLSAYWLATRSIRGVDRIREQTQFVGCRSISRLY